MDTFSKSSDWKINSYNFKGVYASYLVIVAKYFTVCKITFSSVFSLEIVLFFSGGQGEAKNDVPSAHGCEFRLIRSGRNSHSSADNG